MSARVIVAFAAVLGVFGLGVLGPLSEAATDGSQVRPVAPGPKGGQLAAPSRLPEGAVARLGDSRLRHAAPTTCVVFSPDSQHIITGCQDGTLRVWDVKTGATIRTASVPYIPMSLTFTRGGTRLAVAAGHGSHLRFLHPSTLAESSYATGASNKVALSESGKLVATVTSENILTVSEIDTGLPRLEIPLESSTGYRSAFHPDGKSIAIADRAGKVTLFKVAGGKPFLSFDHGEPINGLVFSGDGRRLATGGKGPDASLKIWELEAQGKGKEQKPVVKIRGVSRPRAWLGSDRIAASNREGAGIYDLKENRWAGFARGAAGEWAVSPDGKLLASTGNGELRLRIWELASSKQLHAENDSFPNVAFLSPTPDGKSVFILAGDAAYRWPVADPAALTVGQLPATAVVAAAGAGRLAVATPSSVLIYDEFDSAKGLAAQPSRIITDHAAGPRAVAVSSDGKRVAYSGESERIAIADAATGKTVRVLPAKTTGLGLAFTRDGRKLAVAGRDGYLRLWPIDSSAGEESDIWRVRLQRTPRAAVAFNADETLVAVTSATMIKVVKMDTGEVKAQLERRDVDDGVFQQVAFGPGSRFIVTGSAGLLGAVHVFDLETGKLVRRLATSMGSIDRLAVFPDGSRAATAGAEEVITVWDLTNREGSPR